MQTNNTKQKSNRMPLLIIAVTVILFFSGVVQAGYVSNGIWDIIDDDTVTLKNESHNMNIGSNETTIYKWDVNGTSRFRDNMILESNKRFYLGPTSGDAWFRQSSEGIDYQLGGADNYTIIGYGSANFVWKTGYPVASEKTTIDEDGNLWTQGNIETDGYISSDSYVKTGQGLYHKDDVNTYLYFTPDRMRFYIGGLKFLDMEESTVDSFIVNPDRYDVDFTVYGDNKYDVLKVDAGKDTTHMGHGIQRGYVTTSRDYTVTSADNFIYVDSSPGNIDIDLPDATDNNGMTLTIFHLGGGNRVDIDGYSTQNINGAGTQSLTAQYDSITIHANKKEAEWFIISDTR